jgi:hypothetical protein
MGSDLRSRRGGGACIWRGSHIRETGHSRRPQSPSYRRRCSPESTEFLSGALVQVGPRPEFGQKFFFPARADSRRPHHGVGPLTSAWIGMASMRRRELANLITLRRRVPTITTSSRPEPPPPSPARCRQHPHLRERPPAIAILAQVPHLLPHHLQYLSQCASRPAVRQRPRPDARMHGGKFHGVPRWSLGINIMSLPVPRTALQAHRSADKLSALVKTARWKRGIIPPLHE